MPGDLATWQLLLSSACEQLRAAAITTDASNVTQVARLRKLAPSDANAPALIAAALDLALARKKATAKWPAHLADSIIADPAGVEMASSLLVAEHKARRIATGNDSEKPIAHIADLCCGIGGDALALRRAGLRVTAVDIDPVRAWMAAQNADCESLVADVTDLRSLLAADAFHLDPARRTVQSGQTRRTFDLDNHLPNPTAWRALIQHYSANQPLCAAIKLGPGVDPHHLDDLLPAMLPRQLEYISERGRLTQAVLWLGQLAHTPGDDPHQPPPPIRATLLTPTAAHSVQGLPTALPSRSHAAEPRFLFEPDPSLERSHLLHLITAPLNLHELHPGLGLLVSEHPWISPWLTSFEILHHDAWNERRVAAWFASHHAGVVEVKTRGKAIDPDPVQRSLSGTGANPFVLFVLRLDGLDAGQNRQMFICRRPTHTN